MHSQHSHAPPPNASKVDPYPTSAKRRGCARQSKPAPPHPTKRHCGAPTLAVSLSCPVSFVHADLTSKPTHRRHPNPTHLHSPILPPTRYLLAQLASQHPNYLAPTTSTT